MAQTSWPFENIDTTEVQFSQWARHINEGIRPDFANELEPFADDSGLIVKVKSGQAMVRGHYYANTAEETLTITTPDATNPRIDSVVLELDIVANSILLKVVAGTPAASPVAPTLTQSEDGNVYQFLLGNVAVAAGVFSITAGDVTDLRTYMFQGVGKWSTATRPANPIDYQTIGYNTDLNTHEVWNGSAWTSVFAPITTEGDLAIGDNTGTAVRLPIGAADTVLTSNGTTATWAEAGGGGGAIAYQAPTSGGTFTVSIEAGTYGVLSDGAFPKQLDNLAVSENTNVLNLDSTASSLTFPDATFVFNTASNIPNQDLRDIAYGNGVYVACGFGDTLVRSTDGVNWTDVSFTTGRLFRTVAYGAGLFVLMDFAVDFYWTSSDGITWTQRTHPGGGSVRSKNLRFLNGNFILCQDGGELRTSTDGLSWTLRTTGVTEDLSNAFFGDGVYVAVGDAGRVITSTDSITWIDRGNIVARNLQAGVYGNGTWVVVGDDISGGNNVFYSTDSGATWTRATAKGGTLDYNIVIFDGTQFIVAGQQTNEIEVSTDAIDWTVVDINSSGEILSGLYQDDRAFFVGDNGEILSPPSVQTLMLTSSTVETLS